MRKKRTLLFTGALTALISASIVAAAHAGEEAPVVIRSGNVVFAIKGNASPTRLPRTGLAPVSFHSSGTISTSDGSHPPALEEVVLDVGKAGTIEAGKFPACREDQLTASTTEQAERRCPHAIVGRGTVEVEVEFPEADPFTAKGPVVVYNGGQKGRESLLFLQTYVDVPTPTALVSRVVTTREHKGPYRLHSVAKIPLIAGGAGSITSFHLNIGRKDYLTANCSNGHFSAHVNAKFRDGTTLAGGFIRPCTAID
jgi:hypothetical protein